MKNQLKNEGGFTLVELMVVVAIIGILSAVAIPQFRTYQAKSRSAEAKIQLSAIYQSQMSLLSDYDNFGSCLQFAGYTRDNTPGVYYYAVGFLTDAAAQNTIVRNNGGAGCLDGQTISYPATKTVGGTQTPTSMIRAGSNVLSGTTFIAGAAGAVTNDNIASTTVSQWTVNENKTYANPQTGY